MSTMKLERSLLKNEDDAKINWAPNGAAQYSIPNTKKLNFWGEYPGYRIRPDHGTPIHSTVIDMSIIKDSGHIVTHHMYVTMQKDTERHLTHSTNNMDRGKPLIGFSNLFDGKDLES
ncbi:copper amine oxidase [Panaeolus papilionaceus]|nr:copper amine oxidase [Panaeolus papilionaceus]